MKELLLELFSEEIPPLMQRQAAEGFKRIFREKLLENELEFSEVSSYASPRRICVYITDIEEKTKQKIEHHKGPATDAPEKALSGFVNSLNISQDDLEVTEIKGKNYYCYNKVIPSRDSKELLKTILPEAIYSYTWPKSMYWGDSGIRWVRPLRSILALWGSEIIEFSYGHLTSSNITYAHKYIYDGKPLEIGDVSFYFEMLNAHKVILGFDERYNFIKNEVENLASSLNLKAEYSNNLLEEITGLVEYPVVLNGKFEPRFLELPPEVLASSMQQHQKFIPLYKNDGTLTEDFIFAANIEPEDRESLIRANEQVLKARLADAKFFFDQDLETGIEKMASQTSSLLFHSRLGSLYDKTQRVKKLTSWFSPGDNELLKAAELCNADLTSEVVGEFADLQGIMGYYYVKEAGFSERIAGLVASHYKPKGLNDQCPDSGSWEIAVFDKIDNLASLLAAGEKATGSKDPYALRRSALGIIRIITSNKIHLDLAGLIEKAIDIVYGQDGAELVLEKHEALKAVISFIEERAKYYFKASFNHKLIDALLDLNNARDILVIKQKLNSLQNFISSSAGADLVEAFKRAYNILETEGIDPTRFYRDTDNKEAISAKNSLPQMPSEDLFKQNEEKQLYKAINTAKEKISHCLYYNNYASGLETLTSLHANVDEFFSVVRIDTEERPVKENRLSLLLELVNLFNMFAKFQRIIK